MSHTHTITRNMSEATFQIANDRAVTHKEGVLRECVSAGLLVLDHGEYTPTRAGYEESNRVAVERSKAEQLRRANSRTIARSILARQYDRYTMAELATLGLSFDPPMAHISQ